MVGVLHGPPHPPVCTLICFLTVLFPLALVLINILMVFGLGLGLSASVRLVLAGMFIPCSYLTSFPFCL